MRRGSYILVLALMGVLAICSPVSAQPYSQHSGAQVDVGIFYDNLSPYGDWVEIPDYGWSWAPRVERGWRPYTRGQWVMTDDGWFWDSDEHFGWAAYHYGRWINHPYYGWIWIPGTEWAPAWVSWRYGGGYTGWAPLPPRATWQTHVGLNIGGLDIDAFIGANDYAFVPDGAFMNRGVYQQILPPTRNVTIINVTNNVTNYTVVNQRVFNGGIAVANVEKAVGRRLTRARTVDVDRFDAPKHAKAGEVAVFRPQVKVAGGKKPAQGKSLVKGDEPPARLADARKESEQERQKKGNKPEVTAKDVQKQPAADQPRDVKAEQQDAQRKHEQARRDSVKPLARDQDQQRLEREKRPPNDQQQRERARQDALKEQTRAQDQKLEGEKRQATEQRQRDQARQDAVGPQAKDQDQQRLEPEKRPTVEQPDPTRVKPEGDPQAQSDKRPRDARKARENARSKGKKPKASPTPPPASEKE